MLIISSKGNKAKYKYVVFHYNEVFTNDTIRRLHDANVLIKDLLPYSIAEQYDFFMVKLEQDVPEFEGLYIDKVEVTYSKCKFTDLITEHRNKLFSAGINLVIDHNVLLGQEGYEKYIENA